MAYQSRVKTWIAGEILYATDLNAEFDAILATLIPEPSGSAQGDILYKGASSWSLLAAGTSGQFLKTQGTSANPTWAAASDSTLTTRGDVLYRGASANARLAAGTAGMSLTTGGAGADPAWAGMTTVGDIEYHNGTTRTRLAKGTASQVLQMNSGATAPEWATGSDTYVTKALFDANTILAATTDNTPAAVAIAEQRVLGRVTSGNIAGLTIGIADDNILQVDDASAADDDFCRFTAAGIEGISAQTALSTLLAATMLENDALILDTALSEDGKYNGITQVGVAGATLVFGDVCYQAVGDTRWELAKADAAATSQGRLGICVLAASGDEQPTKMLLWGQVRADAAFPSFTAYAPVFISSGTAGDLVSTVPSKSTGHIVRCVGQAITANELEFHPSPDWFEYA